MKLLEVETTEGKRVMLDLKHAIISEDPSIELEDGTNGVKIITGNLAVFLVKETFYSLRYRMQFAGMLVTLDGDKS